jgi:predicted tellurium resistance membrane protein TerC
MYELLTNPAAWAALATLTALEIVLGIDNVMFLSILVSRLPKAMADQARLLGIAFACLMRIGLLFALTWLMGLSEGVLSAILIIGGLFLIGKATLEIHKATEHDMAPPAPAGTVMAIVILQIVAVDLVFSIDSIVTAIGMAEDVEIMVASVIIACGVMYAASGPVAQFVGEHPTTKMLALAFLVLIGAALVADGVGYHIPREMIYFAMAFSAGVEGLNIMSKRRRGVPTVDHGIRTA